MCFMVTKWSFLYNVIKKGIPFAKNALPTKVTDLCNSWSYIGIATQSLSIRLGVRLTIFPLTPVRWVPKINCLLAMSLEVIGHFWFWLARTIFSKLPTIGLTSYPNDLYAALDLLVPALLNPSNFFLALLAIDTASLYSLRPTKVNPSGILLKYTFPSSLSYTLVCTTNAFSLLSYEITINLSNSLNDRILPSHL